MVVYKHHFSLAVVTNLRNLLKNTPATRPQILIFDSKQDATDKISSTGFHNGQDTATAIRGMLSFAFRREFPGSEDLEHAKTSILGMQIKIPLTRVQYPKQENDDDCGVFVLQYIEEILFRMSIKNKSSTPLPAKSASSLDVSQLPANTASSLDVTSPTYEDTVGYDIFFEGSVIQV